MVQYTMDQDQAYGKKLTESLGESEIFIDFQQKLSRAAQVDRPVLIIGERGSGKEMAASRLHFLSSRWDQPLVTINCAALPPSLIETELFGHESGAFTGASKARKGRFEEANHGTLFLDEIGLIPLEVQEKILRVVEYGTYERVGSSKTHEVDVRIIGATNADLLDLCEQGEFKQDLLDRLSFEVLFLPPLRERKEDILLLAGHFANRMAYEINRASDPVFSDEVVQQLHDYPWPGNIRELKNTIERAVYRTDDELITSITLNPFESPFAPIPRTAYQRKIKKQGMGDADALENTDEDAGQKEKTGVQKSMQGSEKKGSIENGSQETQPRRELTAEEALSAFPLQKFQEIRDSLDGIFLERALQSAGGNQKEAASLLGLSYDQFRGLYRKYKKRGEAGSS